jgi:hypothetical protein
MTAFHLEGVFDYEWPENRLCNLVGAMGCFPIGYYPTCNLAADV